MKDAINNDRMADVENLTNEVQAIEPKWIPVNYISFYDGITTNMKIVYKMEKSSITLTAVIKLQYNKDSKEFKDALESYRDMTGSVDDDWTMKYDMLKYIGWHLASFGPDSLIEGVGHVSIDGIKPKNKTWCGIDVDSSDFTVNGTPKFDTEIE